MPRVGREYITLDVNGNEAKDRAQMLVIEQAILATFGERVAYQILRLSTIESIEDALRDSVFILKASGGKLPVILVNITYPNEELAAEDFAMLESQFALRLLGEKSDLPTRSHPRA